MPENKQNEVCIVLGVWGEKFIKDFLQLSVLSLLAPGNIPALASVYKVRFVFLTRSFDIEVFEQVPIFQKLKKYCQIEFIPINDLIVIGNYSTTLTLAYDRAVKKTGEQMLNTYFIFLTSDYIMADGSFQGLMRYMAKGYSGICAGNFQVVQEGMEAFLEANIDHEAQHMAIPPRKLLEKSFTQLHPISIASIFENSKIHNYRANRFFYRQNNSLLAGRFYLLHMLCIKPETTNYNVGASCDYSFIPEMCPSGNIAIITDSDDYLVVEIQPKEHELGFIKAGNYQTKHLITALAEWTTKQHRENAKHTIYYHSQDLSAEDKSFTNEKLESFINKLTPGLEKTTPKPFYNHPYWVGAVNSFNQQKNIINSDDLQSYYDLSPLVYGSRLRKIFNFIFGVPPFVHRIHYRHGEHQDVMHHLRQHISAATPEKTIGMYTTYFLPFMRYSSWLKTSEHVSDHILIQDAASNKITQERLGKNKYKLCIFFLQLNDLDRVRKYLTTIQPLLESNSQIVMVFLNQHNHLSNIVYNFQLEFAYKFNNLINTDYKVIDVATVHDNFTFFGNFFISRINFIFDYSKIRRAIAFLLIGLPGSFLIWMRNAIPRKKPRKKGHCTNILVTLAQNSS